MSINLLGYIMDVSLKDRKTDEDLLMNILKNTNWSSIIKTQKGILILYLFTLFCYFIEQTKG